MLTLGSKIGESVVIELPTGEKVTLTLCYSDRSKVRLQFDAPESVLIYKREVHQPEETPLYPKDIPKPSNQ